MLARPVEVGDPEWMQWANCRDTDPDVFFPVEGGSIEDAKRICARCPVDGECLTWALVNDEEFGVWGGMSEHGRRRLRKAVKARA